MNGHQKLWAVFWFSLFIGGGLASFSINIPTQNNYYPCKDQP